MSHPNLRADVGAFREKATIAQAAIEKWFKTGDLLNCWIRHPEEWRPSQLALIEALKDLHTASSRVLHGVQNRVAHWELEPSMQDLIEVTSTVNGWTSYLVTENGCFVVVQGWSDNITRVMKRLRRAVSWVTGRKGRRALHSLYPA